MSHKDKVAIVTGASMGIGRAIAHILAEEGCAVVCAARSKDKIERTAAEVRERGQKALAIPTDVGDAEAVRNMVNRTMETFGRIDILINNAGGPLVGVRSISPESQDAFFSIMSDYTFSNISEKDWQSIFNINLNGVLNCSRCVLPIMQQQGAGHIVNITSKAGKMKETVVPGMIAYATAKAAISRFTEVLAFELMCSGSPIRVNALSPGMVAVSFHENLPPEERSVFKEPDSVRESLLKILDDENDASGEVFTEEYSTWYNEISGGRGR